MRVPTRERKGEGRQETSFPCKPGRLLCVHHQSMCALLPLCAAVDCCSCLCYRERDHAAPFALCPVFVCRFFSRIM